MTVNFSAVENEDDPQKVPEKLLIDLIQVNPSLISIVISGFAVSDLLLDAVRTHCNDSLKKLEIKDGQVTTTLKGFTNLLAECTKLNQINVDSYCMGTENDFANTEFNHPYLFVHDVECTIPSIFENVEETYFRKHVAFTATYAEKDSFSNDLCEFLENEINFNSVEFHSFPCILTHHLIELLCDNSFRQIRRLVFNDCVHFTSENIVNE